MLISPRLLNNLYRIKPKGVLHVGAHDGEEQEDYDKYSWGPVTWVEAMPDKVAQLNHRLKYPNVVIQACVWDSNNEEMILHEANNGQSTSLFEFGTHESNYPEIEVVKEIKVLTKRLDSLAIKFENFDFLNLDIQGAELQALKGLGDKLLSISYIYSEVNREAVYIGCAQVAEIDNYLSSRDFKRIDTIWTKNGWGDAIWVKKDRVPSGISLRRMARKLFTLRQMIMMNAELAKKKIKLFKIKVAN
jgi:FkbM family methyltransferase